MRVKVLHSSGRVRAAHMQSKVLKLVAQRKLRGKTDFSISLLPFDTQLSFRLSPSSFPLSHSPQQRCATHTHICDVVTRRRWTMWNVAARNENNGCMKSDFLFVIFTSEKLRIIIRLPFSVRLSTRLFRFIRSIRTNEL